MLVSDRIQMTQPRQAFSLQDIERLESKHAGAIKKLQEESGKATAVAEMVGVLPGGNKDTF